MSGENSYIGMMKCFLCGESKGIILDMRLQNTLPREGVYDREPCDKCKKYMEEGVILISVRVGESGDNPYRTGGWCVVKEEAIRKFVTPPSLADVVIERRMAFVPDDAWDKLGLPRPGQEECADA